VRIVLDTNSLIVSIGRKSKYRPIFDSLIHGHYTLLVSNDILSEYTEILQNKTNETVARNVIAFLLRSPDVQKVDIHFKWSVIYKDADDNKFADCAFNANADCIVTDDRHFKILNTIDFPQMKVMRTGDFLVGLTK
jgi:putative PIN family toxin of toxin-antitoxin system